MAEPFCPCGEMLLSPQEIEDLRIAVRWTMTETMRMMKHHVGGYTNKRKERLDRLQKLYDRLSQTGGDNE